MACAVSPPVALPALIAHAAAFAFVVPHLPLPMVPVDTVKVVVGKMPFEVMVIGVGIDVGNRQPFWPLAVARHSTK